MAQSLADEAIPIVPIKLQGACASWPATGKWSPDYLKSVVGPKVISVGEVSCRLGRYLEALSDAQGRELPYLCNVWLRRELPELQADLRTAQLPWENWLDRPEASRFLPSEWVAWCELFISRPPMRLPRLHFDPFNTHAWTAQFYGTKRYYFWPPRGGLSRCPRYHHI